MNAFLFLKIYSEERLPNWVSRKTKFPIIMINE